MKFFSKAYKSIKPDSSFNQKTTIEEYYNKGKDYYYNQNKTKEALECYDQVIKLNPDYAPAYAEKANVLRYLGNSTEALEMVDKAIQLDNSYLIAYYYKVSILLDANKRNEAEICYMKAIQISADIYSNCNNSAETYFAQANVLIAFDNKEGAVQCYDKAISLNPNYTQAYYNKGNALGTLKKHKEAISCYDMAIKLNPNYADAYNNKGNALSDLGKKEDAIQCYDMAIKLNPNCASAYSNKGVAFNYLGKYGDAIQCYDMAIKLNPSYDSAYNNKGLALSDLGKYGDAIQCYDMAITLNPNDADVYSNKGVAFNYLGRKDDAIQCYDMAIKLNPNYASAYSNKGYAFNDLGRKDEAIQCYDMAIKLNPNHALAYCNKGKVLNDLGKENEALVCFNKAYEINKTDNLGSNLSQGNINYINSVLSNDRETLLKKITELQKVTTEINNEVNKLDFNSPTVKKVVELFKSFTKKKTELTNKAIDSLDPANASKDALNHESFEALSKQISELQAQIQQFYIMLKQGQADITIDINTGFVQVKEEQKKQTKELKKYGKHLEANSEAIKLMTQATTDMKAKIASDSKTSEKDKQIMESRINAITEKMQSLAKQEDVETITQEIFKLVSEARITKGRLIDLEEDVDILIERQNKTDERIQKIELFNQTIEDIRAKITDDSRLTPRDKEIMGSKINSITGKVQDFIKQEDIELIIQEIYNLIKEGKITKGRLSDLEEDIDRIIKDQDKTDIRLNTLETFQITVEKFITKLLGDGKIDQQDKSSMQREIKNIAERIKQFASQATIHTINDDLEDIITNTSFTHTKLNNLYTKVNILINKQEEQITIVNMTSDVIYDNPILNNPILLDNAIKHYGTSKALDLSQSLTKEFIDEAIRNNDSELLLAGIMSLHLNNHN